MLKGKKSCFLSLFVCAISILILGVAVPAQADIEYIDLTFTDLNQQIVENYDNDPWKGYISLTVTNNSGVAWGDFHFSLFDFGGYSSQVTFVDGTCSWAKTGTDCNPTKTPGSLDSWNKSTKNMDLYYYSNPVYSGETVTFEVYTDNTANQQPFGVGFTPSVVPEPVSSTLFIIGAATMGYRRFRKKA